ncbi:MAG: hypothetical protein LBG19_00990 [Prevotellaceae bacterium]|nr:hypothetical protein [Prevotellaceae bacterium]
MSSDKATTTSNEDWNYTKKRQRDSDKEDLKHAKNGEEITPKGDGNNGGGKPKGGLIGEGMFMDAAIIGIIEQLTNPDPLF